MKVRRERKPSFKALEGYSDDEKHNLWLPYKELVDRIMRNRHSWAFNQPVTDAEAPHYHDIIKHPMDLGTIKTNLNSNTYKTVNEFISDVHLVWANAHTYNDAESPFYKYASELSELFENGLKKDYNKN